ncbi:hypothetical protein GDO78_016253 [Eleutherodactylus coqui]|uniref:BH3-interacting domain death agonist n=1 Tax=Eleutherodactylus coqui TaxID=57060 RepID=A0A8J6BB29_ELECQ|nr:hypothetical protein GDO78_016253 [Eleutherodactylus coqui]
MSAERIFLAFLECQKNEDPDFKVELQSLVQSRDQDDDLQTDSSSGALFHRCLETDGPQPIVNEDLCRRIGAQLAEMGDRFQLEDRIKSEVVESLVHDILSERLTEKRFEDAVRSSLDNLPAGLDMERATLVVAMSLTSRVASNVPNLLQSCFTTALNFIQRNCRSSLGQLTNQG